MVEAGPADDRLPWLDTPRPARKAPRPARRTRAPLLLLLGLLLASTVAVMAFLAGRGSGPFAPEPRASAPPLEVVPAPVAPLAPEPLPLPTPVPAIPVAPPPLAETAPAAEPVRTASEPRTPAAKPKRTANARPSVKRSRGVTVHRNTSRARMTPPRYQWPVPSAAGPSGRVIQLGAYYDGRQTMAAWKRLRRAYPYLATLPRKVTVVTPGPGRPRFYRLRIGAQSPAHARAICDNLHRVGRDCTIV